MSSTLTKFKATKVGKTASWALFGLDAYLYYDLATSDDGSPEASLNSVSAAAASPLVMAYLFTSFEDQVAADVVIQRTAMALLNTSSEIKGMTLLSAADYRTHGYGGAEMVRAYTDAQVADIITTVSAATSGGLENAEMSQLATDIENMLSEDVTGITASQMDFLAYFMATSAAKADVDKIPPAGLGRTNTAAQTSTEDTGEDVLRDIYEFVSPTGGMQKTYPGQNSQA